jgi:diaminohydroxyphosphoribosylaminopyrimidine deaminase/5-amino-6-(5-phosphoribosylamino)uracil reductase
MRAQVDAVMVGIGTVVADNPRLNVRLGRKPARDPVRIVVDTRLRIDPSCNLLQPELARGTLIVTGNRAAASRKADLLRSRGAGVLGCALRGRRIDLASAMRALGKSGISHIMLEGGATLIGEALRCRIVDRVMLFYAPKLLGGSDGVPLAAGRGPALMKESTALTAMRVRTVGSDLLVEGSLDYGSRKR